MEHLAQAINNSAAFAKKHYGDQPSVYGRNLLQHCLAVAKLAEHITRKLYQDVRNDHSQAETNEQLATIVQGAMLHDVINVSCAFEDVAEQTTVQIAALVADLSRDYRLVETKRDMEFRGRLSQSPVSTQIVAIADVMCTLKEVINMIKAEGQPAIPRAKKILAQLDGDLLAIPSVNLYYVLRMYSHAAKSMMREASQLIKDCRAKARMDRLVAQGTAGIRAKMAAKVTPQIQEQKPDKLQKEARRGKKRTNRKNS